MKKLKVKYKWKLNKNWNKKLTKIKLNKKLNKN